MPKSKTHSGSKKRFKLSKTGVVRRKHAFKRHNLGKKSTRQKRRLTHTTAVHAADLPTVRKLLLIGT